MIYGLVPQRFHGSPRRSAQQVSSRSLRLQLLHSDKTKPLHLMTPIRMYFSTHGVVCTLPAPHSRRASPHVVNRNTYWWGEHFLELLDNSGPPVEIKCF